METSKASLLNEFVRQLEDIPTIPSIVYKVISLIDDPTSSVSDLERVIANDQTTTAKLLKLSNSAFYGFSRRVNTVHQAIIVIGFNAVKSIVIGLSVFDCFRTTNERLTALLNGLWMHSLGVATLSKEIALRTRLATPESAFVCGLLHDFGKVIFVHRDSAQYAQALAKARELGTDIRTVEEQMYRFSHADLGGLIAQRWQLPVEIAAAAREHHSPPTGEIGATAKIVSLANALVHETDIGWSGYDAAQAPPPDLLIALGLDTDALADLRNYLASEEDKIRVFFEVMTTA